jgi:hypothetical protein
MRVKNLFLLIALILGVGIYFLTPVSSASDPSSGDWPMWGGTPDRNMTSSMKGLPTSWDVKAKKNVKWVAQLGSQTYGNVVVADSRNDRRRGAVDSRPGRRLDPRL